MNLALANIISRPWNPLQWVPRDLCIRLGALLLVGSVMTGLLAPVAVAMSRADIVSASEQDGLSSDVKDFFFDVLEDAMLRSAVVAPISAGSSLQFGSSERVLFAIASPRDTHLKLVAPLLKQNKGFEWSAHQRVELGFMNSGEQPLGP